MRDVTAVDLEHLTSARAAEVPLQMDEEAFRAFYDRTARALWAYLSRVTGDRQLADDLLQETYYRFLRAGARHDGEVHRRRSLFLIATNLVRDGHRRRGPEKSGRPVRVEDLSQQAPDDPAARADERTDLSRAMARLRPRDRSLLWLAYGQGSSHREIAETLGLKTSSVKLLLFRARRRLAGFLAETRPRPSGRNGS